MSQNLNIQKSGAPTQVFVTFFGRDGSMIQSSGVSNVTKLSEGEYEIQFENAFSNKYYACSGGINNAGSGFLAFGLLSPTQLNVTTLAADGHTPTEMPIVSVIVMGM
jgi:hypothetical protein